MALEGKAALDRHYYATLSSEQLRRKLDNVRGRAQRADNDDDYLCDLFAEQEIEFVLQGRGACVDGECSRHRSLAGGCTLCGAPSL